MAWEENKVALRTGSVLLFDLGAGYKSALVLKIYLSYTLI